MRNLRPHPLLLLIHDPNPPPFPSRALQLFEMIFADYFNRLERADVTVREQQQNRTLKMLNLKSQTQSSGTADRLPEMKVLLIGDQRNQALVRAYYHAPLTILN